MTTRDKGTGIKFMDRNPPAFSEDSARRIAEQEFALEGEFTALASERDQNFRVRENGSACVLKISNADEAEDVIDFQIRALEHIERHDPGLPVPRVLRNAEGEGGALGQGTGRFAPYGPGSEFLAGDYVRGCGPDARPIS